MQVEVTAVAVLLALAPVPIPYPAPTLKPLGVMVSKGNSDIAWQSI